MESNLGWHVDLDYKPSFDAMKNAKILTMHLKLECFFDSDWSTFATTRRSMSGYIIKFGGSLVLWKNKKQSTVIKSSVKA